MKKVLFTVIIFFASGAELTFAQQPLATPQRERLQKSLERLKTESPQVVVRTKPRSEVPQSIKNLNPLTTAPGLTGKEKPSDFARLFLEQRGEDLFLVSEPRKNIHITSEQQDPNFRDRRVVRVQQTFQGVPIFGAQAAITVKVKKGVSSIVSELVPSENFADITTQPKLKWFEAVIDAAEAYRNILSQSGQAQQKSLETVERTPRPIETKLQIFEPTRVGLGDMKPRLTWLVRLGTFIFFVDAQDGTIVYQYRDFQSSLTRMTWDLDNQNADFEGILVLTEQGSVPNRQIPEDAQKAHDYAGLTFKYYSTSLDQDSLFNYDNQGSKIYSYVREDHTPNAHWDTTAHKVIYGPQYPKALDIVAHELTHGVIQQTAELQYAGGPGAVNESFADFFGVMIEASSKNLNWTIGETLPGYNPPNNRPLRNMADPHNGGFDKNKDYDEASNRGQPDHIDELVLSTDPICKSTDDQWSACVHFNSGILNKAAYLAANGGKHHGMQVTGIGATKFAQIMFGALNHLVQSSDMPSAAHTIYDSCIDLFGTSQDCAQVKNAYTAVGFSGF